MLKSTIFFIRDYVKSIGDDELSVRAAALAYYALFSLFPLMLLLVSAAGFILHNPDQQQRLLAQITDMLPTQGQVVGAVIEQVVQARSGVGLIGMIMLLWSASGFFGALEKTINRVFGITETRPIWKSRGLGILMAVLVVPLLLMATASSSLSGAVSTLTFLPDVIARLIALGANQIVALLINILVFYLLYRFVPCTRPPTVPTLIGAAVAAVVWATLTFAFAWYLGSGFANYALVYGSIGAVIALTLWLYLTSFIILLGAELADTLHRRKT